MDHYRNTRHFCLKSPAFQWYVNDFLGSGKVAAMSLDEVGAYTLLLNYDWNEGGLPDELTPFGRWLKVSPRKAQILWDVVRPNFVLRDGRWYNPRLEKERAKQKAWAEKSARGGHASAIVRWGDGDKGGDRVVTECLIPNGNTPSPSSTPVTTKSGYPADFELLWKAYPKREGSNPKSSALKAYNARLREGVDFTVMQDGTNRYEAYARTKGWVGTEYVMLASRFFGTERGFLEEWAVALPQTEIIGVGGIPSDAELRRAGIRLA